MVGGVPVTESEWSYATAASAATSYASAFPRITSDPSQYALANGNIFPTTTAAPYPGQVSNRVQSIQDSSGAPYPPLVPRPPVPAAYYGNIDSQTYQQCAISTPQHGLPSQVGHGNTSDFSAADPAQQWLLLPSNDRQPYQNLNYGQDNPSGFSALMTPYPTGAAGSNLLIVPDRSTAFPGLSPLVSNLPAQGANRVLPEPLGGQSLNDSSSGAIGNASASTGHSQRSFSSNNGYVWASNRINAGTSQGSVGSAAQGNAYASGGASSSSSSSTDDYSEATAPTFAPLLPVAPLSRDDTNSTGSGTQSMHNLAAIQANTYSKHSATDLYSVRRNNNQLPNLNTPLKSSNTVTSTGRDSSGSSDGARRSQATPRLLQPQPHHSIPHNVLRGSYAVESNVRGKVLGSNGNGRSLDGG